MIPQIYKENKEYRRSISSCVKMSARERNVKERLALLKKTGIIPPAEVLEIGSHEGLFLKMAKENGFNVLGIEPNIYAVRHSVKNGVTTIRGYFEEVFDTIKHRKFDVVALFHVLEHMPDYMANLAKIKCILKPEGYLILEVPNIKSYRAKKYGEEWMYIYEEHLHNFYPEKIKKELSQIGFEVTNIYFRDFDCAHLSLRALLDRLLPFKFRNMNVKIRNQVKEELSFVSDTKNTKAKNKDAGFFLASVKFFLAFCVKILKRGDFIMVVAQSAN